MQKANETPTTDEISTEDVLGALIWRLQNAGTVPPRILCMSQEARERNLKLARDTVAQVRRDEATAKEMREAGNPRAFFGQAVSRG